MITYTSGKVLAGEGEKQHFGVCAVIFLERMALSVLFVPHNFIYFKNGCVIKFGFVCANKHELFC